VTYRHSFDVRYGECDVQGVVFNAHYLAYADHAVARWFADALPPGTLAAVGNTSATFDFMVKRACVTWSGPTGYGEILDLDCSVPRWGTTSFDVRAVGSVAGDERVEIELVYVSVAPGTHQPCPVPEWVKAALA